MKASGSAERSSPVASTIARAMRTPSAAQLTREFSYGGQTPPAPHSAAETAGSFTAVKCVTSPFTCSAVLLA